MLLKMLCDGYSAVRVVDEAEAPKSTFSCLGVEGLDVDEFLED